MKKSLLRIVVAGGVFALISASSQALDLRFAAGGPGLLATYGVLDVEPINMVVTDAVLGDGTLRRSFVGQAEGMRSWLVDRSDGMVLSWGDINPQALTVQNTLHPSGVSRTVLSMQGIDQSYSHTRRIGTIELTYNCMCDDLFQAQGNEPTEKAFSRYDRVWGVAAIERYDWEWVPAGEDAGIMDWVLKERQELVFGSPVPEATTWAMGIAGAMLVMAGQRRKHANGPSRV